eukprot:9179537-Alexandrium_andersonii.AAC.2
MKLDEALQPSNCHKCSLHVCTCEAEIKTPGCPWVRALFDEYNEAGERCAGEAEEAEAGTAEPSDTLLEPSQGSQLFTDTFAEEPPKDEQTLDTDACERLRVETAELGMGVLTPSNWE